MNSVLRLIFFITLFTILLSNSSTAQTGKGEFIDVSIGLGYSFPSYDSDLSGSGFYAQGEYVYNFSKWFGIRPYAGLILTKADKNVNQQDLTEYKVTSNALLLGGKVRVSAPIPWIAPYFEIGIGTSIGSFETYTPYTNIKHNGILMHIPWSIGLALGRKHNFDIAFTYYDHPYVNQTDGAAAIGFSFPLD